MRGPVRSTIVSLLLAGGMCAAQTMSPEKRREFAEQAAIADGYRQLRLKIGAMKVDNSQTVGDIAAGSSAMAIALRRLVAKAERVGSTRYYSNGDAEVDLKLSLRPGLEGLLKAESVESVGTATRPLNLDARIKEAEAEQVTVTGFGSAPTDDELTDPPGWPGAKDAGDLPPPGWANVQAAGFQAAERAAELDALEHLGRQIEQLRMERSRTVGDWAAAVPAVAQGLRRPFSGVRLTKSEYLPEQVCRIYAEVDIPAVITRLKQLRGQVDPKVDVTDSDVDGIARLSTVERLRAAGYGLPPASLLRQNPYAVVELDEPEWAKQSLRATAAGSIPRLDSSEDRLIDLAVQDARIAAQLRLAEQMDTLELPGGGKVQAFLSSHENLSEDILRFLSGARTIEGPTIDRGARRVSLTLELPLERLWLILRQAIPAVEATTKPSAR